jgi:predicted ribosome quality control (RQC) complex YloA/Tae2 family protein
MRIRLSVEKDAKGNADSYYSEGKDYRQKAEKAGAALKDMDARIAKLEKAGQKEAAKKVEAVRGGTGKREWFWQFRHFTTGGGKICIAGRNADENEEIVKKYLEEGDLFVHADIHGGAVAVIKGGKDAGIREKLECAVFAASYSNAWEIGYNEVDVFAAGKGQITKTVREGNLKKGGFGIEGEREWFKHSVLGLLIGKKDGLVWSCPWNSDQGFQKSVEIRPGGRMGKEAVLKKAAKALGCREEELSWLIPQGRCTLRIKTVSGKAHTL